MDNDSNLNDVIIKKEPPESPSPLHGEDSNNNPSNDSSTAVSETRIANSQDSNASDADSKASPHGSLRYVSRRGRPPGGGYSMKSHSPYMAFGSTSLMTSQEFSRQGSLGHPSSALSPQEIMKSSLDAALDTRRFGFHSFDSEKNSFRCEGCDVVFSSRDTYAMHMLLRAKNESCVALPTAAISSNPENPTPREKFERELREKAMLTALRNQAALMSKAAAVVMPKNVESLSPLRRATNPAKDDINLFGSSDVASSLSSILAFDNYGLYMDQRQYRRLLSEYGLRSTGSGGTLSAMMEQLSCSVCGELFTNKDALAMHMMFHTRDGETETKPTVQWRGDSSLQSSHSFGMADLDPVDRDTDESNQRRRQESSKSNGDRQLTAERIAELKRMAIESSLRSSLRKHANTQEKHPTPTRPKSVSEDMVVTSSAQTRPLSADDAFKISNSSDKGIYKPHKTAGNWDSSSNGGYQDEARRPIRKRHLSLSNDSSFDSLSLFADHCSSKRKQFRYDHNSLSALTKSNHYLKSVLSDERDKNAKVCDNHVSSASGPQDSDETSDGSSSTAEHAHDETTPSDRKVGASGESSSPSLETIMSSDTILVPVENLEDMDHDDAKDIRRKASLNNTGPSSGSEIGAIDFSVGKRDRHHEGNGFGEGPTTGYNRIESGMRDRYSGSAPSFQYGPSDMDDEASRELYLQQHHVELIPGSQAEGQRSVAGRSVNPSPLRSSEVNGNSSDSVAAEASSRVGEARYCPHCEILFLDVTLFHLHMGLHNVNNPWQCNTCGIVCGGRLEFNTHVLHY